MADKPFAHGGLQGELQCKLQNGSNADRKTGEEWNTNPEMQFYYPKLHDFRRSLHLRIRIERNPKLSRALNWSFANTCLSIYLTLPCGTLQRVDFDDFHA